VIGVRTTARRAVLRACVGSERSSRIDVDEQLALTEALLAAPRRFRDLTTVEGRADIRRVNPEGGRA
jgi:hypothetical protein